MSCSLKDCNLNINCCIDMFCCSLNIVFAVVVVVVVGCIGFKISLLANVPAPVTFVVLGVAVVFAITVAVVALDVMVLALVLGTTALAVLCTRALAVLCTRVLAVLGTSRVLGTTVFAVLGASGVLGTTVFAVLFTAAIGNVILGGAVVRVVLDVVCMLLRAVVGIFEVLA